VTSVVPSIFGNNFSAAALASTTTSRIGTHKQSLWPSLQFVGQFRTRKPYIMVAPKNTPATVLAFQPIVAIQPINRLKNVEYLGSERIATQ
jgi:hypothetical protein